MCCSDVSCCAGVSDLHDPGQFLAGVSDIHTAIHQVGNIHSWQCWQYHYRPLFTGPKTVQASVTLLDSLPIFLEKTNKEELEMDIIPMLYLAMESSMSQVVEPLY